MPTNQPNWECIGQLGDKNPIDHGGYFILRDRTGVYPEEGEKLFPPEDPDERGAKWEVRRFILDRCTYQNGILSDNQFHPNHAAWFAKPESERAERPQDTTYLKGVADYISSTVEEMIEWFCSENALDRARAYEAVGDYHGWANLDDYPLELTKTEVKRRYRLVKYRAPKTPA